MKYFLITEICVKLEYNYKLKHNIYCIPELKKIMYPPLSNTEVYEPIISLFCTIMFIILNTLHKYVSQ